MAEALHHPFEDDQASIEYAMLWTDAEDTIWQHADSMGIGIAVPTSLSDLDADARSRFALQSKPEDGGIIQLWGFPALDRMIGQITLSFQDADSRVESHCYELLPNRLTLYRSRGPKQTKFTRDDLEELRADLGEIEWDLVASGEAAKNTVFWDI